MALPHFGEEQPGETYYLTRCNLEGFGMVDVSHHVPDATNDTDRAKADHLYFHCYREGTGGKGGNNHVASLIMKTLKKLDVTKNDANGLPVQAKELNIVMDNCGGQNKKKYVILLAPYLVELGYFEQINMLFLVVGHTKNVCDRRFNSLKQLNHKSNVYTIEHAMSVLNKSKHVTVWPVDTANDWYDYHQMLFQIYKSLAKAKLAI
jgi:hypothetical protein